MIVRDFEDKDLREMVEIWNEVVEEGVAFPQKELLDETAGKEFFAGQTATCIAGDEDGHVSGLYILHPNNIGRVGHIANASYAVKKGLRGRHIGAALVEDSLKRAKSEGFRILQFNAVVDTNVHALNLYGRLGFTDLGIIPGGFLMKDGSYEDIHVMYHEL